MRHKPCRPSRGAKADVERPIMKSPAAPASAIVHFHKGRGVGSNHETRFDAWQREADRDFLDHAASEGEEPPQRATTVTEQTARSIISRNNSPDIPFDQSINPYQGCEHGCVYCYARPTHAYIGLSPGLDFETRIFAKTNAAELLRAELSGQATNRRTSRWAPIPTRTSQPNEAGDHPRHLANAGGIQAAGRHHDQIGTGRSRYRHPGANGRAGIGTGIHFAGHA